MGPLRSLWAIGTAIASGSINVAALALGAATLIVILLLKGSKRLPGVLVAVIGATVATGLLDLRTKASPFSAPCLRGLPSFAVPWIGIADLGTGLDRRCGGCLGVVRRHQRAITRICRAASGSRVNPNQEMIGLGAANLAAGFFHGFPISSSSSRTPVAEAVRREDPTHGCGWRARAWPLLLVVAPTS